ncbi:LysM peptidoglycan-binding domain-containing protein [Parvularcula maris]|uniref:LysM peptidoglycan-binding domain-containing protein n=1 Tax=Parvularcula maris TaxID=2965077 RepID=A0A9X2RKI4_9PROT|nr:LysM peptidoglycan-binding domain-containing protein [Parvularcula maris]MCQ8185672.1 LysM peptidoglycan-binding domain-containing protein [Parvularcula maris]
MRNIKFEKASKLATGLLGATVLAACTTAPRDEAVVEIIRGEEAVVPAGLGYDRYQVGMAGDRYGPSPVGYQPSGTGGSYQGFAAAREAHRLYDEITAEGMDGGCEPVVSVSYGDTLSDVAEYCDTPVAALLAANPSIRSPHHLRAGQRVAIPRVRGNVYEGMRSAALPIRRAPVIPAAYTGDTMRYVVRYGDTISEIAARYGTSTGAILALNPLIDPYALQPGDKLLLPAGATVLTPRQSRTTRVVHTREAAPATTGPVVVNINGSGHVAAPTPSTSVAINVNQPSQPMATVNRVVTTPVIERTVTVPAAQRSLGQPGVHYEMIGTTTPTVVAAAPTARVSLPASTVGHVAAAPSREALRYQASLPSDGRSYNDLGTACMRINASGEQEVYRVAASASGPSCGADKPVRLYKASN